MFKPFSNVYLKPLWVTLALFTLITSLLLKGCNVNSDRLTTLQIGTNTWPGYDVALYAQEAGLFAKRGLEVEFSRFDVAQDTIRSLLAGNLDAAFVSLWELMQVQPGNDPLVYLMVTNVSHGSDGLVVTEDIASVADLKGKTIGAKLGTVSHLILLEALKKNRLNPEDVNIQDISNPVAIESIQQGKIKAAVLWEPDLSETAQEINGSIPFTTADVDSLVIDGFVSRASYVQSHPEELTQFILAWFDLMQEIETQPQVVFNTVGELLQQSGDSFASDYSGLKKGDIEMNRRMFAANGRLEEAVGEIAQLLQEDPRHNRVIVEDVKIDPTQVMSAIAIWEQEQNQ